MELLQQSTDPPGHQAGGFERGLDVAQLTPGDVAPVYDRLEAHGSLLLSQHFAQGVQLRSTAVAGRVVIGCIEHQAAPILRNGILWRQDEAVAYLHGPIDVCSHGACTITWIETELPNPAGSLNARSLADLAALRFRAPAANTNHCAKGDTFTLEKIASLLQETSSALARASSQEHRTPRYAFARRVEDLMWEHVDESLSLGEISKLTGRSVRAVHYSIHTSFGLGPVAYFRIRRLNAVRERLLDPNEKEPIIDIAARYGFWHLGHFGSSYKRLFGEPPSQTRHRTTAQTHS